MKSVGTILAMASMANAHTLFSNLFINGESQGDTTCIRTPSDGKTATSPIYPLDGNEMACGYNGGTAVDYICNAPGSAQLTFDFRVWPNYEETGAIDPSHKGPCAVYVKKVDDIFEDAAHGPGWMKIWEDGYNTETEQWCTETLIENDGFLSVNLPSGLPSGYYFVRPELLALHSATDGDPQFYQGCAQIFIESGPEGDLSIPDEYSVSIPGYIQSDAPGLSFNLYDGSDPADYEIPGPKVYYPESSETSNAKRTQDAGQIPENCILKAGNWCAVPLETEAADSATCWAGVEECWDQSKACWDDAPIAGWENCKVWDDYCSSFGDQCDSRQFVGTPEFKGKALSIHIPDSLPEPYNQPSGTEVGGGDSSPSAPASSAAPSPSSTSSAAQPTKTAGTPNTPEQPEQPENDNDDEVEDEEETDVQPTSTSVSVAPAPTTTLRSCAPAKTIWETVTVTAQPPRYRM